MTKLPFKNEDKNNDTFKQKKEYAIAYSTAKVHHEQIKWSQKGGWRCTERQSKENDKHMVGGKQTLFQTIIITWF